MDSVEFKAKLWNKGHLLTFILTPLITLVIVLIALFPSLIQSDSKEQTLVLFFIVSLILFVCFLIFLPLILIIKKVKISIKKNLLSFYYKTLFGKPTVQEVDLENIQSIDVESNKTYRLMGRGVFIFYIIHLLFTLKDGNSKKVFLYYPDKAMLAKMISYLRIHYPKIKIEDQLLNYTKTT